MYYRYNVVNSVPWEELSDKVNCVKELATKKLDGESHFLNRKKRRWRGYKYFKWIICQTRCTKASLNSIFAAFVILCLSAAEDGASWLLQTTTFLRDFLHFLGKWVLVFHVNHLLADDSHEILSLILFLNAVSKFLIFRLLQSFG